MKLKSGLYIQNINYERILVMFMENEILTKLDKICIAALSKNICLKLYFNTDEH